VIYPGAVLRQPLLPALLLVLAGLSLGCINTDAAVFVEPQVTKPEATVSAGALVTGLKGSFQLSLHLGPRATGPSQVTLGAVEIRDAKGEGAIVAALPVTTSPELPVTVDLDSDVPVTCSFDTGAKSIAMEAKPRLCDAAGVKLGGTLEDSLQNHATPFSSAVFHVEGCE
jgi:hypothetical protein